MVLSLKRAYLGINGSCCQRKIEKIKVFNYTSEAIPLFLLHYFIKQKQLKTYEDPNNLLMCKHKIDGLQIDFAEYFSTLARQSTISTLK